MRISGFSAYCTEWITIAKFMNPLPRIFADPPNPIVRKERD